MGNRLTRFEPFNDIARFDTLRGIEELFRNFQIKPAMRGFDAEARIKIDVTETDLGYSVKAEIPGCAKEDIHVDVDGNQITIRTETKRDSEEKKGETMVRSERYWGEQCRSFTLTHAIDEDKVVATYRDGVLDLTLPKKLEGKAKKIVVD